MIVCYQIAWVEVGLALSDTVVDTAVEADQRADTVEMGVIAAVQFYKLNSSIRAMMLPHEQHILADNLSGLQNLPALALL